MISHSGWHMQKIAIILKNIKTTRHQTENMFCCFSQLWEGLSSLGHLGPQPAEHRMIWLVLKSYLGRGESVNQTNPFACIFSLWQIVRKLHGEKRPGWNIPPWAFRDVSEMPYFSGSLIFLVPEPGECITEAHHLNSVQACEGRGVACSPVACLLEVHMGAVFE